MPLFIQNAMTTDRTVNGKCFAILKVCLSTLSFCLFLSPAGSVAQDLNWSVTQPISSGQITAFSSSVSGEILAGVTPAQMYISTDDGFTWSEFAIDPFSTEEIAAIALRDDGFAIVSTVVGNVYRSFDSGLSWEHIFDNVRVQSIFFDSDGRIFLGKKADLFRSDDDGDSWDGLIGVLYNTIFVWAYSINSEGLLYAAAFGCEENICGLLLRSHNGGDTWEEIVSRFDGLAMSGVVVSDLGFVFVTIQATSAVFGAEDGLIPTPLSVIDPLGDEVFSFFSSSENVLVASTISGGIRRSEDNGATWIASGLSDLVVFAASETASGRLLAGTEIGIHRSDSIVLDVGDEATAPHWVGTVHVESPYPNPTTGQVRFSVLTDAPTLVTAKLYSPLGRELMTVVSDIFSPGTRLVEWSMSGYSAGTYFCVVTDERGTQSFPITLVR